MLAVVLVLPKACVADPRMRWLAMDKIRLPSPTLGAEGIAREKAQAPSPGHAVPAKCDRHSFIRILYIEGLLNTELDTLFSTDYY